MTLRNFPYNNAPTMAPLLNGGCRHRALRKFVEVEQLNQRLFRYTHGLPAPD